LGQLVPQHEPKHREPPSTVAPSRPSAPTAGVDPQGLLALQRSIGNRAVVNLLAARPPAPSPPSGISIQRKAGDLSRSDYAILVKVEQFLDATPRNMTSLYPAVKEDLKDPSVFSSADLRKLAISFNTNKVEKFVESKGSAKGVHRTAKVWVTELLAEFVNDRKTEAVTLEAATGGHSVDRHGPEVTDVALQNRLTTGVAPDNVLSVAPGYSSKFVSYMAWLDCRQAAIDALSAAVNATQLRLIALAPKLPGAKAMQDQRAADVVAATRAHGIKKNAHQRAFGQQGEGSGPGRPRRHHELQGEAGVSGHHRQWQGHRFGVEGSRRQDGGPGDPRWPDGGGRGALWEYRGHRGADQEPHDARRRGGGDAVDDTRRRRGAADPQCRPSGRGLGCRPALPGAT
jgi:hypothetical protein